MPYAAVNDVELYYETMGDPGGTPLVLVAGLGVQLISWPDHFVAGLVDAGHFVISFDNRDIGLSTTFDGAVSEPELVMEQIMAGAESPAAYGLPDMAADVAGLIKSVGINAAHVVGVSMGAMIAQTVAIEHSDQVLSLTSIMSSTGESDVGQPTPEALAGILSPATSDVREQRITQSIETAKIWASPGLFDAARLENLFNASWDRAGGPQVENAGRQFCAIVAAASREHALAALDLPALVVHGTADTLIAPSGGERTASLIPNAKLLMIDGMGHDLPEAFVPQIIESITELVDLATTT